MKTFALSFEMTFENSQYKINIWMEKFKYVFGYMLKKIILRNKRNLG